MFATRGASEAIIVVLTKATGLPDEAMNHRQWLTLAQARVNVSELKTLTDRFGDVASIAGQGVRKLCQAGLPEAKASALAAPDEKNVDDALSWLDEPRHGIIGYGDDNYPELLSQLPGAPLLLYINGDIDALHLPSLAVVGSRNPTRGGIQNSQNFAGHLAASGYAIVSGLAQGIDTAAHRGALDAGGATVALLGHGIDRVYPAVNRELAHEIAATGALVSEYPLGAPPAKHHFPERNRLISGLALGTLVVEAARKSGSLITARLAAEQGREVFALPGSIHNPLSRGCHELIRQGAKLVETAADITAELAPLAGHLRDKLSQQDIRPVVEDELDDDYLTLRQTLSHDPTTINDLERESGLTIEQLSSMLLILELHGEVESLSGGRYVLMS